MNLGAPAGWRKCSRHKNSFPQVKLYKTKHFQKARTEMRGMGNHPAREDRESGQFHVGTV